MKFKAHQTSEPIALMLLRWLYWQRILASHDHSHKRPRCSSGPTWWPNKHTGKFSVLFSKLCTEKNWIYIMHCLG